jgi:hypothetical protein
VSSTRVPDNEWQRIWFSIRQQGWTSLALVPSHSGIDAVKVAEAFAETGRVQGERPVSVLNATGVQLENVQEVVASIAATVNRGEWVIVPVDAIAENPSAIAIVQGASAALLLVRLGESLVASAQNALEAVGREKFLGSVVLDKASNAVLR